MVKPLTFLKIKEKILNFLKWNDFDNSFKN